MTRPCITPPPTTEHVLDLTPFLVPDQLLFDVLDVHEADDEPVVECVYVERRRCGYVLRTVSGGYDDEPVLICWSWAHARNGSRVLRDLVQNRAAVLPGGRDWR